ncbi:hypothetical protein L208DRAFT_1319051 [Tricholoma matsutake]|nr:hypothetical protein L208DRAFT_1319051 [Tricholoma matsutake 945]
MVVEVGWVLKQDYAQMKLMDLENKRLQKKAFAKDQQKTAKKKKLQRTIVAERKLADWEQKAAERQAMKVEADAEKARLQAEMAAHGCGRGS